MTREVLSMVVRLNDRASAALERLSQKTDKLRSKIEKLRSVAGKVQMAAGIATSAMAGVVATATWTAKSIEKSFATAFTMFDTTQKEFDNIKRALFDLSRATGRPLNELADALYMVGSAGVDASHVMDVLNDTVIASTAGATDMATTFYSAISIINAYGLSLDDLSKVYAEQFEAVKKGLLTYEELASTFGQVAPAARQLGASLEESLAGYIAMTKAGFSAAESATATANAFEDLVQQMDNLQKLGVKVYDATGRFRGLIPILEDLRNTLRGTQEEQAKMLQSIGLEQRAARAISTWVANLDMLKDVYKSIRGDTEALMEAYRKQIASMSYTIDRLLNSLRLLVYTIWQAIGPTVVRAVKTLTNWIGALITFIREHGKTVSRFIFAFLKLGAVVFVLATALKFVLSLGSMLSVIFGAFLSLLKPLNLLLLAIAGAIVLVWSKLSAGTKENIIGLIVKAFQWLVDTIKAVLTWLGKFTSWGDIFKNIGQAILGGLGWLWNLVKSGITGLIKLVFLPILTKIPKWILDGVRWIALHFYEGVLDLSKWLWNLLLSGAHIVLEFIPKGLEALKWLAGWLVKGVHEIAVNVKTVLGDALAWLRSAITEGLNIGVKIKTVLDDVLKWLRDIAWGGLKIAIDLIAKPIQNLPRWIIEGSRQIALNFVGAAETVKVALVPFFVKGAEWIRDMLKQGVVSVTLIFAKVISKVRDLIWDALKGFTLKVALKVALMIVNILTKLAGLTWDGARLVLDAVLNIVGIKKTAKAAREAAQAVQTEPNIALDAEVKDIQKTAAELQLTAEAANTHIATALEANAEWAQKVVEALKNTQMAPLLTKKVSTGEILGALLSVLAALAGVPLPTVGFARGGFTGEGDINEWAGIVHRGEYVIPAWMVKRYANLVAVLERIRRRGYQAGGAVSTTVPAVNEDNKLASIDATLKNIASLLQVVAQAVFGTQDLGKGIASTITDFNVGAKVIANELPKYLKEYQDSMRDLQLSSSKTASTTKETANEVKKQNELLKRLNDIWNALKTVYSELVFYEGLFSLIQKLGNTITQMMKNVVTAVNSGGGKAINVATSAFDAAGKALEEFISLIATAAVPALMQAATSIQSLTMILSPLTTIFGAMFEELKPLIDEALMPIVGILKVIGRVIARLLMPILYPFVQLLEMVGKAFVWLYNNIIVPIANAIIEAVTFVYNTIVKIINFVINAINAALGWLGVHIEPLKEIDTEAVKLSKIDFEDLVYDTVKGAAQAVGELKIVEGEAGTGGGSTTTATGGVGAGMPSATPQAPKSEKYEVTIKFENTIVGDKKMIEDAVRNALDSVRRKTGLAYGGVTV